MSTFLSFNIYHDYTWDESETSPKKHSRLAGINLPLISEHVAGKKNVL